MIKQLFAPKHSLRFSVFSRLFGLIIILLIALGSYQYQQLSQQAVDDFEEDKNLASNYFSLVLVEPVWDFDTALINELIAAQNNIKSLNVISTPGIDIDAKNYFIRNEKNIFHSVNNKPSQLKNLVEVNLELKREGEIIGLVSLYFSENFYQVNKRNELFSLLIQLFVMAVILLILFYYFINQFVVKPISTLYQAVDRLSHDENMNVDIEHDLPDNEIKKLAMTYTRVYSQLSSYKDSLEQKIENRTVGLKNANELMRKEIRSRIESEKNMQQAKTEAQAANNAKTRFLSHITHELRTPLNGIMGYSQIVAEKELTQDVERYISHILRCSRHLLELINNILDFNKIESGIIEIKLIPASIEKMIYEIKTIVFPRCKSKALNFEVNISKEISTPVLVDVGKLKQILINLLANAIKFTDKGFVSLTVKQLDNNKYCFIVSDSGQGIPESDQNSIFEDYQQSAHTVTQDASTGLGLSISKSIIEHMGGKLELKSEVDKGSQFFFTLELDKVQSINKDNEMKTIEGLDGCEKYSILIVDDNKDNLIVLSAILRGVDFNVVEANSAKEAYAVIETRLPDFIFLDIQMPEIDGVEAATKIRSTYPQLPIVAFTANIFDETGSTELSECFNDYLFKPVEKQAIYRLLNQYLKIKTVYQVNELVGKEKDDSYYYQNFLSLEESTQEKLIDWLSQGQLSKIREFAIEQVNAGSEPRELMNKLFEASKNYQLDQLRSIFDMDDNF